MRIPYVRPAYIAPRLLALLAALAIATPASAQFGGLKKRLKGKTAEEGVSRATGNATEDQAAAGNPTARGGTVVLTPDVVNQLINGLKAGQAERDAIVKEETSYGRYKKAEAAYAAAKPKCAAAQESFPQRAAGNQKMLDKYSGLTQKMVAAQEKQNQKLAAIYYDSAMAMMDPSCIVKEPTRPDDYYEGERQAEVRAGKAEVKASGLGAGEYAMAKERADAILRGATGADISASEKSAVRAKATALKPLMGIQEQPVVQAVTAPADTAPSPAPTPAANQPTPEMTAAAQNMGACMTKNMQAHQKEIEAFAQQAQAAQKAGNQAKLMAIADTVQRIQMAGCMAGR
jgi:hypothetical protein